MIKFAKIIIDRKNNEYRNLHFLPEVFSLMLKYERFMFDNKTHSVENRIVSISQPYIRPIVRGKAKSPVEFGAKLDKNSGYCSEKLHK